MKQRFSSLDVKAIVHELRESLVTLRLSNVYDLSSKIMLFKFAKPDNKKQLVVDAGFRCHLTEFARTTATEPSPFVTRLRKFIKTRRLTSVSQVGTDRVIEFQFSDGQYRLFLEFFAGGNVILADGDLKILALLRNVAEGEAHDSQRVGSIYSLEQRQNYSGVPTLTKDRVRDALKVIVARAEKAATAGKKIKSKPGDELRKGLASTISEIPPALVDHSLQQNEFDLGTKTSDILDNEQLFDALFKSLQDAFQLIEDVLSTGTCKGYIIARRQPGVEARPEGSTPSAFKREELLYEDFHPFLPHKFKQNPDFVVLTFDGFNKTVDEFYSSIEGQRLESRLNERELAAKKRLAATKELQAKKIEGLQQAQELNFRKASAIEANVDRVQEAMDAVNGLLGDGMDWVDIGKLVEREQKRHNPVAETIKLPLKLAQNTITLLLAEEDDDDDDAEVGYLTESTESEDEDEDKVEVEASAKGKASDKRLEIDINLGISPWMNAREYYGEKKTAAEKQEKTASQSKQALKNAEAKIQKDLKKGLKLEKKVLQPIRQALWFEKFIWFLSSDGYLVLAGKDSVQYEMLYRRHLRKGDVYCHSDIRGAAIIVIKNNPATPDAPIPPSTLSQAGTLAICTSDAWDSKAGFGAWWVTAEQVSKTAHGGQILPDGVFNISGEKNFLPPAQLLVGLGILFKVSEESKSRHAKHRIYESPVGVAAAAPTAEDGATVVATGVAEERVRVGDGSDEENESDDEDHVQRSRGNPLQASGGQHDNEVDGAMASLSIEQQPPVDNGHAVSTTDEAKAAGEEQGDDDGADDVETEVSPTATVSSTPATSRPASVTPSEKMRPAKRGQKAKAKKIAAKYKHQDEEDRAVAEALIGAAAGRRKAEAEAQAKAQREAEAAAQQERRREQLERRQKQTAAHEAARQKKFEEGGDIEGDEPNLDVLDDLVGTPLPGDEILAAIPVCAPWSAMAKLKYKAKMQPGAVKKGKAVKEIVEKWVIDSNKKNAMDERAEDTERMWPREVELIKGLKVEEVINIVPVGRVRVMMAGGSSGGGGGGSKGQQGKGGKGGRSGGKK